MKDHYEALGIQRTATDADVRAAYRRVAAKHHPDRSSDPNSKDLFLAVTSAFETLSDPQRRRLYDLDLLSEARKAAQAQVRAQQPTASPRPRATPKVSAAEVSRVANLFSQGRYSEAEELARKVVAIDSRQPLPYAVLGDIARMRGKRTEAQRMYAYAVQFDPGNALYQRRYEELLDSMPRAERDALDTSETASAIGLLCGAGSIAAGALYVIFTGRDGAALPQLKLISSWTWQLIAVLIIGGILLGASLSFGGMLDRFRSSAVGGPSPAVAFAFLCAGSFWGALALYALAGLVWKSLHDSLNRVIAAIVLAIFALAISAAFTEIQPGQVLLWGANLLGVCCIVGWMAADAFRGPAR